MAPGHDPKKIKRKTSHKNVIAPKESQANPPSPVPARELIIQFYPTPLPKNLSGPIPESILKSFNQSLSVGTKMDFNLAPDELRLKWLQFSLTLLSISILSVSFSMHSWTNTM